MSKQNINLPTDSRIEIFLVVEDSLPDQILLKRILQSLGYHVLTADNGRKGVDLLEACLKKGLRPVGIISDILMPEMDGLEFLQKVRTKPNFKSIPFLFLTGAGADLIWDAKRYGAHGYLSKPVSTENLIAKLMELFPTKAFSPQKAA